MAENFNPFGGLPSYAVTLPNGTLVNISLAAHHLLMQSLFLRENGTVHPLFAELARNGFNVTSFAANGAPLPMTLPAADVVGAALH